MRYQTHSACRELIMASSPSVHCRHGVRQRLSCWADGPSYITQCPIQAGQSFTYEFTLFQQKGTLFWHAHISWLRATVNGAIVIYPKTSVPYPFPYPYEEHVLIFGNVVSLPMSFEERWFEVLLTLQSSSQGNTGTRICCSWRKRWSPAAAALHLRRRTSSTATLGRVTTARLLVAYPALAATIASC